MPSGLVAESRWDEFRELHTEGLGRNAISRRMGITPSVISRTAEHLGLSFDRSRIQAATVARIADLKERRSILAERLTEVAEDCLQKMDEPTTVYAFGGKDNDYNEHEFPEAPPAERRALMGTAGMAIDRSLKLAPAEEGSGIEEAKSMLGSLGKALASWSKQADSDDEAATAEGVEA